MCWDGCSGVHGATRLGTCYRIIVIGINMIFGCLSGLQPLLPPGSSAAIAQTLAIVLLQFGMGFLCFYMLPDGDRIVSRFAGTQFFMEAVATSALLWADHSGRRYGVDGGENDTAALPTFNSSGAGEPHGNE